MLVAQPVEGDGDARRYGRITDLFSSLHGLVWVTNYCASKHPGQHLQMLEHKRTTKSNMSLDGPGRHHMAGRATSIWQNEACMQAVNACRAPHAQVRKRAVPAANDHNLLEAFSPASV